jgi:hypothetical protein
MYFFYTTLVGSLCRGGSSWYEGLHDALVLDHVLVHVLVHGLVHLDLFHDQDGSRRMKAFRRSLRLLRWKPFGLLLPWLE